MHKKSLFLAISLILVGGLPIVWAQTQTKTSNGCSYTITRDVQYGEGRVQDKSGETKNIPLLLDVYMPTDCQSDLEKKPIPIGQIHGGGFMRGDKASGEDTKIDLAKAGYAVFSINYRLLSNKEKPIIESLSEEEAQKFVDEFTEKGGSPLQTYGALAATEDSIKAKEFVQKEFEGKIDTNWFLYGGSAGAVTSVNMAYLADYVFGKNLQPVGIIEVSGSIPTGQHIAKGDANVLIIHGTEDTVIPYAKSDEIVRQANEVDVPYQRITVLGSGHGMMGDGLFSWEVNETGMTVFNHMIKFIETSLLCENPVTDACRDYPHELTTANPEK